MAETKYTRTYTLDCPSEFIEDLNNNGGLGEDLLQIVAGVVAGDLDFWFENALTGPDVIAFDAFLAAFVCSGADQVDGEASSFTAKNVSASTLNIGDPVYSQGVDGNGIVQVVPAEADDPNLMPAFGLVVSSSIAAGALGTITLEGLVTGMDTSSFSVEDELFVAVGGGLTATKPTGNANLIQKVAQVQEVDTVTGQLVVVGAGRTNDVPNIQQGRVWLGNGSDVATQTLLEMSALDDVDLTGLQSGDVLQYDGANFVPSDPDDLDDDRVQVVYVGKHGNDSNDGLTPNKAKLTFGSALTVASGLTPTTSNRVSIVCDDGGTYTESFSIPSWVFVKGPNATFVGNITLADNSEFVFQEATAASGDVISKPAGTGTAWATGEICRATGTADGLVNGAISSILIVRVRQIFVETGTGILDNSTGEGHIHMDVEDMYITGVGGTAVDRGSNTGIIVGRISHILETGAGVGNGTALDINDGRMTITVGTIDCATAYNVSGTGNLNLLVNEIEPGSARTQASGAAEVNVIEADSLRWRNRSADFTARRTEFVAIDTSGGPVTMDLPNPASNGDSVTFQDSQNTFTTNNLTVDAGAGALIDDGASGSQTIVIELSGTSGIFIYNETLGQWTFARIQEEVAFSPSNVIYVTKNGSDTIGDGSFSNPYLTVKKGATEALLVANASNPTTVKVLDGVYDEVNPITISGTNSEFVQIQGSEAQSTIIRPTVNGQPLFALGSNDANDGPSLSRLTGQGQNNGGTDYETVAGGNLIDISGNGVFALDDVAVEDGNVGVLAGNGTVTTGQIVRWTGGTSTSNVTGLSADGANIQVFGDVVNFNQDTTAVSVTNSASVDLSNYDIFGNITTPVGTGIFVDDASRIFANGGSVRGKVLGLSSNGTSTANILATTFLDNTTDFNQVDTTARVVIQGNLSKTKQLIADGAQVSLNYIDTDTVDFIVGNANATGDPGLEFRVRDFDGRVFIGDNAIDANAPTNTVGGSRTINLIDTNGNLRIWRWQGDPGLHPAFEWLKGINTFAADDEGDAPITNIDAATDTITIDLSGADYNDPLDPTLPGADRTTLDTRIFYAGAELRVNGTASNDGDYVVVSSTYNSGPQTIDVVVSTDITVTEGAGGTCVFGGGAGRPDGVSTYVGDPGAAITAGVGDVHWDMLLRETDSFAIRRRTGGAGKEQFRFYQDRAEFLGSPAYDPGGDPPLTMIVSGVLSGENYLQVTNAITGNGPILSAQAEGLDTNIDINMVPLGTGTVLVPSGYEANVVNDSLITKAYGDANYLGGSGDVSAAANITDNSIVRGDGGVKGVQDSLWTISDAGVMSGVVSVAGHVLTIQNNTASGEFIELINSSSNPAIQFNQNGSGDGIWRAFLGSGNAYFESDFGSVKIGDTSNSANASYELLIDHGTLGISNTLDDIVGIDVPATGFTDWTLTLPSGPGTSGQVLETDGAGNTSWADVPPVPIQFFHHNASLTQTYSAATTILVNTAVRADTGYAYATGEVTIANDGWYEITYEVTADCATNGRTTGTHFLEVNTVLVPGSVSNTYHRNNANGEDTGSATVLVNLTAGDIVRIRSQATANITTIADGCRLRIESKV